jgi:hypothetical protein
MPLEELDGSFVLLGSGRGFERPEISPLSGLGIFLARVEPVSGLELAYHVRYTFMGGFASTLPAATFNNFHFNLAPNCVYPIFKKPAFLSLSPAVC